MNCQIKVPLSSTSCAMLAETLTLPRTRIAKRLAGMVAVAISVGGLSNVSYATVLEFDQIRESGTVIPTISGRAVEQDCGDQVNTTPMNVAGGQFSYGDGGEGFTPNVAVDYFAGAATPTNPGVSLWVDGYGDLTNVMIGNNGSLSLNVEMTADAGFDVQLYGFDLAGWPNSDYTINAVNVLSGTNSLFSQANVLVEGDANGLQHTSFDFAAPLTAAQLLIEIDYSNLAPGSHDNIGIDNIRFGQNPPAVIPIPAAMWLFGSGLLGLASMARCKKAA